MAVKAQRRINPGPQLIGGRAEREQLRKEPVPLVAKLIVEPALFVANIVLQPR